MSSKRHIHVIGAGMAGLSAALQLTLMGESVTIYEAAPFAGGRCRSYFDHELDCRIDNGNHLVLSGNVAIHDYLFLTNALDQMRGPGEPIFPFMDLKSGERWIAHMNKGRMPWWIFDNKKRVAGTHPWDYLSAFNILTAGWQSTVASKFPTKSLLYRRFWEPLCIAALNTEAEAASAQLLAAIFRQSFGMGGKACCPLIPKIGLSETFVQPCLNLLRNHDRHVKFGFRLRGLNIASGQINELDFGSEKIVLDANDWVILAVPPWSASELLPEILIPTEFRSIINVHFRVEVPHNPAGFTGLIGGLAEWVFVKKDVVSVTISAAERHENIASDTLVKIVWRDLARLFDLDPEKMPVYRIVKEKRATFAATPDQNLRRPRAYTQWNNLALAGDWTATGLPSTIEGAIRSGVKAAQVVLRWGS